ncbi:hypothetical protein CLHUN_34510 [Ruminiclostridium hungatei]|uniref:tRNA(Met) cytidine acetate ligase n=1 Tax=Ruminiclostridium hungatei TaxID=48256 RepID=A0A1V4SFI4_RUMHU|nr:nucleotidyltransferase [Ruminiclostridium hungatei]OPX42630.1 hypothetical protein CLHUN_34510 [Ruminiclostridium hungatei]
MKVLGIVVEYNPFHNGHIYHMEKSREITGCDAVVCVMSGNFIQRGEPAFLNKTARAEIALNCGADLVLELPHPYAMASAESFAFGAVKLLEATGITDSLCFGSEHGDISALQYIAGILAEEPEEYKKELKKQLSLGLAYPVCRQKALYNFLETENKKDNMSALSQLLETSNNILGIEYLKALKRLDSSIRPYTIARVSNSYNSSELTGPVSSATAIRNSIQSGLSEEAAVTVPPYSRAVIEREFAAGRGPNGLKQFENIILSLLRWMKPAQLRELPDVSEGLEYRLKNAGELSGTIEELIKNICTRRYAQTRIQRILFSMLTGLTRRDTELFMEYGGPQYARILGFNHTGRTLLSKMKKNSSLPIITKTADFKTSCNSLLVRMLELEAQATDMYVLGYKNPAFRKAGQEFTQNVTVIK